MRGSKVKDEMGIQSNISRGTGCQKHSMLVGVV